MGRYDGKFALITGGTSGIGLATAALLVAEGARVAVTGRDPAALDRARGALGPQVSVRVSDAGSTGDIGDLVGWVRGLGRPDLVFVNAGITAFAGIETVTEDGYDELFAVNTRGPYFLLQGLAPLLGPGSAVVVTTSVADERGLAGSSVYAASKAAVRSMVRSFARELLPQGVRVNAVSPGPVDTGILERALPAAAAAQARRGMEENNPMARFGRPEEVAAAVAFLGVEATFTTGAELPVDGGVTQL